MSDMTGFTLNEWAERAWPSIGLRPLTLRDYQVKYERDIAPVFGGRDITSISKMEVQAFVYSMPPVKQPAVLPILQSLYRIASENPEESGCARNPTVRIKRARYKAAKREWRSMELIFGLDFKAHTDLFRFMAKHGTRWSETQGIQGEDFFTDPVTGRRKIWIKNSRDDVAARKAGVKVVGYGPKNGERRAVPYMGGWRPDFPVNYSAARKRLATVTEAAFGVPLTIHSLRYSYANMLARTGVPLKEAQELLGHATMSLTSDLYTQVDNRQRENAASVIETYLANMESA